MRKGLSYSLVTGMGAIAFALVSGGAFAQSLTIGSDTSKVGENIELPLTLDSKSPVQGLTVVLEWEADSAVGKDFDFEPVIEKGDTVVERIEKGFFVLGVVMDSDGKDNEVIPAGEDILLGTLILQCQGDEGSSPVRFVDGKHASVAGGPLLDNVIVIEGKSIGDEEGLDLENGSFQCKDITPPAQPTLKIGSDTTKVGDSLGLPLTLDSKDPVQGLTVVLEWDADSAEGKDFVPAPVIQAADTVVERVEKGFFVLGVVMDSDGKDNEVIAPGEDILLGTLILDCKSAEGTIPVRFVDGKHASVDGGPLLDNVVVIGGESIGDEEGLNLDDGSFKCEDEEPGDEIDVDIDVRPGSCPNNVNLRSHGKLKIAILGSDDLDVDDIESNSIRIEGARAIDVKEQDVAGGEEDDDGDDDDDDDDRCECERTKKDGINDLVLRMNTQDLTRELLEDDDDLEKGDCVTVTVTGRLEDGTRFRGEDVVRILGMPKNDQGHGRGKGQDDDDDDDDGDRNDLNRDGAVDVRDVVLRARLLFEQPHEIQSGQALDVDGDGQVNAQDAVSAIHLLFE